MSGVCPSVNEPERFPNPGCWQLALPVEEIPVAQLLLLHCEGVENRAVAVAALPVVLLEILRGRSPAKSARKVGVAGCPDAGPANKVLADCVNSWGVSVPVEVTGDPDTVGLKMIPSPPMATLVTDPEPIDPPETNIVRTSVTDEIAELLVTTVAMGIVVAPKPVVFDAGAQLLAVLRYT